MTDSTVTLGDVAFDPVATQDFRLSVEGTSSSGKSNTIAVLLEDLANVAIPTLIVERLGALSPARLEDEAIVVVGAREEDGVDLAVALEDLDQIGSWVLDRGMKILVDVSTYEDYEEEKSRQHLAASEALRSLNDRAHEKYRSGDRTKSLLVVDEAHMLAPKNSAPEPQIDEWVKRCRGQLIKASTEGGNKGISVVVGYQRRAFLHNGTIQLCDDFIAHKPGSEDIERTAEALRCSEDDLAELETGEILARGAAITDNDLVGPTKVRKRRSPDPREESFELPDTPDELADVLEEIQSEVEAERERRDERQDELERLREENERLREQKEELEQELADVDRLGDALERLGGGNGGGAAQDVGEGVQDLQERVEELKGERDQLETDLDHLRDALDEAESERDRAEERVADLEAEVQELRSAFDGAAEEIAALAETFEVDVDATTPATGDVDADVQELRDRVGELEAEREQLKERLADAGEPAVPTDYEGFVEDDVVQEAIADAKDEGQVSEKYVRAVIAAILDDGQAVTYDRILEFPGVSKGSNHTGRAVRALEDRRVVSVDESADPKRVDFNVEGVREIKAEQKRRARREEIMEDI